jgi:hypothetical protein
MIRIWSCLLCAFSAVSLAQTPKPASSAQNKDVMIVSVAHDGSAAASGIGSDRSHTVRKVWVDPLAWLTPSGEWKKILCDDNQTEECKKFEREYWKKPHTYTVVSADGRGALVKVKKMSLGDCFGYEGEGTFFGNSISFAAVAAESDEFFRTGQSARRLGEQDATPIRKALAQVAGNRLDSIKELRVYSVQLEGQNLIVVQRALQDYANRTQFDPHQPNYDPDLSDLKSVFAIGTMKDGHFYPQHEMNIDNGNELILGTIHMKNGHDFLVTSVNDSESQDFRIYGIRNGKLTLVFSGGGSSC